MQFCTWRRKFLRDLGFGYGLQRSITANVARRRLTSESCVVLGIESSCDDTGAAVVNEKGEILGEAINSQAETHWNHGGIIPPIARDLHAKHVQGVVESALKASGRKYSDLSAIAATVKPGLTLSLLVGARYAQKLCLEHQKPFIPVHHMEAHALTSRMEHSVEFPFLVLLVSGGHCLLAVAKDVNEFLLLGKSLDDAPGEAFDKTARRLKLSNLPHLQGKHGGVALEALAAAGNPLAYKIGSSPLSAYRDCNFSFAGLKNGALRLTQKLELEHEVEGDGVVPGVEDVCASFQHAVVSHICKRVQRAMLYVQDKDYLAKAPKPVLVVSGGVACNQYLRHCLSQVCTAMDFELVVPRPALCTDNGIMIAWNGVEHFRRGLNIIPYAQAHEVDIQAKCPLGVDMTTNVAQANIKCSWVKLLPPS